MATSREVSGPSNAKRVGIVVLVALIAAVPTAIIVGSGPESNRSSVELDMPSGVAGNVGGSALYFTDFSVALTSNEVVQSVSEATGLSTSSVRSGLATERIEDSRSIDVTFTGSNAGVAANAAQTAARAAATRVAQNSLGAAQQSVQSAENQYRAAVDERNRVQASNPTGTAAYDLEAANAMVDATRTTRREAQETVVSAQSGIDRTNAPTFLGAPSTEVISKSRLMTQSAILAAALAAVVMIGILTAIDVRNGNRRQPGQPIDLSETTTSGARAEAGAGSAGRGGLFRRS